MFLESRFHGQSPMARNNVNQLSQWVRPYMRSAITTRAAVRDLIGPYFKYLKENPPQSAEGGQWKAPFAMPNTAWLAAPNGRGNGHRNNRYGRSHSNRLSKVSRALPPPQAAATQSTFQSANAYRAAAGNQRKYPLTSSLTQSVQSMTTSTSSTMPTAGGPRNGAHSVSPPNGRRDNMGNGAMTQNVGHQQQQEQYRGGGGGTVNSSHSTNRFFSAPDHGGNGVRGNGQSVHSASSSSNVSPLCGNGRSMNGGRSMSGDDAKTSSISPPQQAAVPMAVSMKGSGSGNARSSSRKRKYVEFQNENEGPSNTQWAQKRMKSDVLQNGKSNDNAGSGVVEDDDDIEDAEDIEIMKPEANCVQCRCGAVACGGDIKTIELQQSQNKSKMFIASRQPFPCQTAENCIWSSQLGLTFMWHKCTSCKKQIGFHVVGASTMDKLQYIQNILFLPTAVKLLRSGK